MDQCYLVYFSRYGCQYTIPLHVKTVLGQSGDFTDADLIADGFSVIVDYAIHPFIVHDAPGYTSLQTYYDVPSGYYRVWQHGEDEFYFQQLDE